MSELVFRAGLCNYLNRVTVVEGLGGILRGGICNVGVGNLSDLEKIWWAWHGLSDNNGSFVIDQEIGRKNSGSSAKHKQPRS